MAAGPMEFTVRLSNVDPAVQPIFAEVLKSVQDVMQRSAGQLQSQLLGLRQEVQSLRRDNENLNQRLAQKNAAPNGGGNRFMDGGARVPGYGAPAAPRAPPAAEGPFQFQKVIKIHEAPVHAIDMQCTRAPQSPIIATASWDTSVKIYSLGSGDTQRVLSGGGNGAAEMGGLYAVAFSKTAPEILGCTSCDKSVYLWNHTTGESKGKLTGHADEVNSIDFHTSQQVMCTASDDKKVIIWDFQEGITLRTLDKHTKEVYGATFLGEQNQYSVATCCFDQITRIFDMRDKKVVQSIKDHTEDIIGISYSGNKNFLATGSDDGRIMVYDVRQLMSGPGNQNALYSIDVNIGGQGNEVKRVAFSPDGSLLAAGCSSGEVLVYDMDTCSSGQPYASLGKHDDCVFDVAWGECQQTNARLLVSASHDKTCRSWRCDIPRR